MSFRTKAVVVSAIAAASVMAPAAASATSFSGGVATTDAVAGLWFKDGGKTYKATGLIKGIANSTGVTKSGDAWIMNWKTTDPRHRVIAMTIRPTATGVQAISLQVTGLSTTPTSVGIDFKASKGEQWLGFGERADKTIRGGASGPSTVENYVSDGPWQPFEWNGIGRTIPAPGFRGRLDATYFPIPWTISTRGYGVLIDNNETSRFTFGGKTAKTWSADVDGGNLSLRVFSGGTPAQTLGLYTQTTGRQPAAAAPFYFGPWVQMPGDAATSIASLKAAGSPTSLGMTYSHYLPCGSDRGNEASMANRASLYHDNGMAVTTYFNPMVCESYSEAYNPAVTAHALTKKADGTPYNYVYVASSFFHVGQFDFTNPLGVSQFQGLLQRSVDHGYDGWMEDFGEYTPADSVATDGTPGTQMHNLYVREYHKAASDFSATAGKPLARFQRSGWSGTAPYAQVVWGGDPTTWWDFDGLSSVVKDGIGMGLSGISLWGSDIGGYFSVSTQVPALQPELLKRWIEVGFASGVMRNETDGLAGAGKTQSRTQITDAENLPIWAKYSKLRTQLYPYLSAAEKAYDNTGVPIMRSLMLDYPTDAKAVALQDEYGFGPDFLAAPVLKQGATTRSAYLPKGDWVDFWRSARLNPSTGALEPTGSTVLTGGKSVTVPAPIDQIPLFVKAGAAIPLVAPDVWTLADYGTSSDIVHLSDRQDTRRIVAFPRGTWTGALGVGETLTSTEGTNTWSLAIASPRTTVGSQGRTYAIDAALGTLKSPFIPGCVKLGSTTLPTSAWSYAAASKVLKITATTATGTINVSRSC